jgi:PST family polysaccharide transporter
VPAALLARGLEFKAIAFRELVGAASGGVVAVVLAFRGWGAGALVAQMLTGAAVGAVLLWVASRFRPRFIFSRRHAAELVRFGAMMIGIEVTNFANVRFQDLVVGYVLGPVALGYFTIAMRVLWLINRAFGGVANAVGLPTFSRMEGDRTRLSAGVVRVTRLVALVALPCFAGLSIVAAPAVELIFGPKWLPAAPLLMILSLIGPLQCLLMPSEQAVIAAGRPGAVLAIKAAFAIMGVGILLAAVQWGVIAVSLAYVVRGYLLLLPMFLWLVAITIGVRPHDWLGAAARPALASAIMAILVLGTMRFVLQEVEPLAVIVLSVAMGVTSYIACLLLIARGEVMNSIAYLKAVWFQSRPEPLS